MKFQIPLLMISIAALVLVSGCISADPATLAKLNPMVQEFLNEHPDAEIRVTHYSEEEAKAILGTIEEECQKEGITAKEYYRISIEDKASDLEVTAWIDWENQVIECAIKEGSLPGPDDDECKSLYKVRCYEGDAYWYDSCGNRGIKKEDCANGCDAGRCLGQEICKSEGGYCSYVGLVEEAVISGEVAEVIASTKTTDTLTGMITGAPFAEANSVTATDVSPLNVEGEERCVRYYICPNGRQFQYCELIKKELPVTCVESNVEGAGKVCTAGGVTVACVCKTEPELLCASEDTVCRPGYQKSRLWCPDNGICCMPVQTECKPEAESRCYAGHAYWYDSCGNRVRKREYCQWGCEEGRCKPPPVDEGCFETDKGYNIYEHGVCEAVINGKEQRLEDHCNEDGTLTEKFCADDETIKWNTTACPDGYECREAACRPVEVNEECIDSDGGMIKNKKGSVSVPGAAYTDQCLGSQLIEHFCDGGIHEEAYIDCNCFDGVCYDSSTCTDTEDPDGPRWYQDEFTKGTVTINYIQEGEVKVTDVQEDECFNDTHVIDVSCSPSDDTGTFYSAGHWRPIECENGCSNGACIEQIVPLCTVNSDCGSNSTQYYCVDIQNSSFVYENLTIPTCINAGTENAYCSDSYASIWSENCSGGCSNGDCI